MSDKQHPMYKCPKCKTKIPFGTAEKPAPIECPGCHKPLWIPEYVEAPQWLSELLKRNQPREVSKEIATDEPLQTPVKRSWRQVLCPLAVTTWFALSLLAKYLEYSHW
jgi:transcription initiation factor IIE alpha subunit